MMATQRLSGTQAHRHTDRVGCDEVSVGRSLFGIAWRSRNPRGGKFLETFLSAHVSSRNLRGEKLFTMFLSAYVVPRAPARTRYQPKPARNGHAGGLGAPLRTRYQPKPARNGILGHHCAERRWRQSFSPHTFPPETRAERSFSKSFYPRRFRFRQAVPERNIPRHHAGNPLPS